MADDPFPRTHATTSPLSPLAAEPRRGGRVVGAALLVGALAGAVAGVGGAALLQHNDTAAAVAAASTDQSLTVSPDSSGAARSSAEAAAATALPSVVKIYATSPTASGSGSGIVLTKDGQILTNNHVVEPAANGKLAVSFSDGTTAAARIVGRDPLTDLAVIQARTAATLTPATLGDSDSLAVGEPVVALGSPFGLESTVTTGIVSALNRPVVTAGESSGDPATVFPAIQTDAAINPGNSGGPLINLSGEVVGIDSAIKTDSSTAGEPSGSIGLGFAIPINDAIPIVEQLRNGKTPTHARIGVTVGDAIDKVGLPDGALVDEVAADTAASRAGLRNGDVISKLDGHLITDADSLVATVRSYRPGDTVTLTVSSSTRLRRPGAPPVGGTSTGDTRTVTLTPRLRRRLTLRRHLAAVRLPTRDG